MAGKRKKAEHGEEGGEAWLLPYSDLMTLLLAVFIVLFAVSKVDSEKAGAVSEAFRNIYGSGNAPASLISGGTGLLDGGDGLYDFDAYLVPQIIIQEGANSQNSQNFQNALNAGSSNNSNLVDMFSAEDLSHLQALQTELESYFHDEGLENVVMSYIDERGLIVSLTNSIFFDSGSASLRPDTINVLLNIGKKLAEMGNYIRVEGHTDDAPINTPIYPSNWELSCARASGVVKLFIDQAGISPDKLVAVGYGEHRPVADNSTPEGRAKNRRVDIITLNQRFNRLEE